MLQVEQFKGINMKKCLTCQGHKYTLGMGNMKEDCKICDAKGFISEVEPVKVTCEHVVKKKKGKEHDGQAAG